MRNVNRRPEEKHVDNLADLIHRIAILAATELGDALRDATQGRAGRDALIAAAQAMRTYVKDHPGRYAAGNAAQPTGPDDPLTTAINRLLGSLSAVLRGYQLDPAQEIHALRMLRSTLHGFATLEVEGGFRFDTDVNDSFAWIGRPHRPRSAVRTGFQWSTDIDDGCEWVIALVDRRPLGGTYAASKWAVRDTRAQRWTSSRTAFRANSIHTGAVRHPILRARRRCGDGDDQMWEPVRRNGRVVL